MRYTTGPWKVIRRGNFNRVSIFSDPPNGIGFEIARVNAHTLDENHNAVLIKFAPDMYETMRDCLKLEHEKMIEKINETLERMKIES